MSYKIALQMDPLEGIRLETDTSFRMGLEAQKRGCEVWHYQPHDLNLQNGRLSAWARPVHLRMEPGNHFTAGAAERIDLHEVDAVFMRQDPPFDMSYITATHLLEHIRHETLVVNDPVAVRNAPEKLLVMHYPQFMAPTLVTSSLQEVRAFREEHKDIIIKPLYGFGGSGVFHLAPEDENLISLYEMFMHIRREPIMVQAYLPAVREGDKRVILIEGKIAGALNRIPQQGQARANTAVGGTPVQTKLTAREVEICETIGPVLAAQGVILIGLDLIGECVTEVNITCPTGLALVDRLSGTDLPAALMDAIEARLTTRQAA